MNYLFTFEEIARAISNYSGINTSNLSEYKSQYQHISNEIRDQII